jgi:type III pantothenate kinase
MWFPTFCFSLFAFHFSLFAMLLAIDIGNSSIKFGIFEGPSLFHKFSIQTKRDYTVEELLFDRLKMHEQQFIQVDIDTCVVASVVPDLNGVIGQVCRELFKVTPRFVDETWDFGLKIKYEPPSAAGVDRLVNAFAAVTKYGWPVIVCSFGTATTIDIVNERGEYLGGVIAPGMAVSAKALQLATAKLPNVPIEKPDSVIGKTTVASIQSGIVLGHIAMVEGLIAKMQPSGHVIATGGFARLLAADCKAIDTVDENLTLDGLRLLAGQSSLKSVTLN